MTPETSVRIAPEMEFSVKKFDLLEELSLTQGVVERKTTIPILSNLLFEAKGNRLTITATDLELSIRTSCEAKVKKELASCARSTPFANNSLRDYQPELLRTFVWRMIPT